MRNLTPEEVTVGKGNFHSAIGSDLTRREFLQGTIAAGVVSGAGLGAAYFGYQQITGDPVRVGVIGTGDEGNVLIGAHTPQYVQMMAIADIRPFNIYRAFHGDESSASALKARPGLLSKYDWKSEDEAKKHVKVYGDYKELLKDPDIEAVIIALPLHLHAAVAIEAMQAGKHVLTEKLMAHSVSQCKDMVRVSRQTGKLLATGHQRHYSILYDNAKDLIHRGLIGDLHHIRAQWHRGNLPGKDSWQQPLPEQLAKDLAKLNEQLASAKPGDMEKLMTKKRILEQQVKDADVDAAKYGYQQTTRPSGYVCSPLEELIRWRLWNRTGGGLMAELGSHQLDASSIFISAMNEKGEKVQPLRVSGIGCRNVFPDDRDIDDHVHCMFEFPAPGYESDPAKRIVVSYSSINGNGYGGYGECVFGTKGTLILEREQEVMLFKDSSTTTNIKVAKGKGGAPTLDTTDSGGGPAAAVGKQALESGPVSRGYTEEIEHWAWCIRNPSAENQPKCKPEVAMADAIIALVSNQAMAERRLIEFKKEWFDIASDETPNGVPPSVKNA